ncbi:MAG TPA: thiamine-phosphate kinase [Thermomonas sp.]|jgi:thiamine-monophosphate kinase|uniref:thiamine-phosphate kinase n=1 Tax=Thermomonas sp. TaxID=1971895 RepID=UPI002CC6C530|nr:thiamine-phosphate kinase [Thermomonas sp.]HOV97058.1 thiamine-phosphate kinase [Thermomonas sp.]
MHEFDLIARIRARAALRGDVVLGIGDDCALLAPPAGMQLAVTMDTLNVGVHFPADTVPYDIGWKALAVNLSDLAAMGAQPAWCTLSLSLPGADAVFLDGFTDGFLTLAKQHDFALIGGDTTRGPLSISVTAHGLVAPGSALRRTGAQVGDDVWVSGTLGDAAGALRQWQQGDAMTPVLRERLDRPIPRVALGRALRGLAHACIDISDGLLADLAHICNSSGVGAQINVDALPASAALREAFDVATCRVLQASGGDDYELCFTAPPVQRDMLHALSQTLNLPLTHIGEIVTGTGVCCAGVDVAAAGYQHFA